MLFRSRDGLTLGDLQCHEWMEAPDRIALLDRALWERAGAVEGGSSRKIEDYLQLAVQSQPLVVSNKTQFGEHLFRPNEGSFCQCSQGRIRGLRLISELCVERGTWGGADVCETADYMGNRLGLFRPWRCLVVSKQLLKQMQNSGMKGFHFEVARLV